MGKNINFIGFLLILIATTCLVVYVIPTSSGQSIEESFDSYGYASGMEIDADSLREAQRFLYIYPEGVPPVLLQFFSVGLHFTLLLPILYGFYRLCGSDFSKSIVLSLCLPESLIFLGCVSKEGLAIVACFSMLFAHVMFYQGKIRLSLIAFLYSSIIAELSRPWFSLLVGLAGVLALFPLVHSRKSRRIILAIVLTMFPVYFFLFYEYGLDVAETYFDKGRDFLSFFEDEMASDSGFKNYVRKAFSSPLLDANFSVLKIIFLGILSLLKALVYLLAMPIISLPQYKYLPAQIWTCCWQFAVTSSSVVIIVGLLRVNFKGLSPIQISHYVFSLSLMYILAASTLIFHVRYRAPAAVVLVASIWMVAPKLKKLVYPMFIVYIGLAVGILIRYY